MLLTQIYEKSRYIGPYEWLINCNIQEWDLAKANISIFRTMGLITDEDYHKYLDMPKQDREISIGYLRRDNPQLEEALKNGMIQARQAFFDMNSIDQENVLYIDNDSITTVHQWEDNRATRILGTINPFIVFRTKNKYTSMYRLNGIDFLYFQNGAVEKFRLKNINQENLVGAHKGYFLDFILSVAYTSQNRGIMETIQMIRDVYQKYVSMQLDTAFYREFGTMNKFKIMPTSSHIYYTDTIRDMDKDMLDISYNASIIKTLYKIFMNEYFKHYKPPRP